MPRAGVVALVILLSGSARCVAEDAAPRYAGRTQGEWNDWFKSIDLSSSAVAREAPTLVQLAADPAAPPAARRQATLTLGRLDAAVEATLPLLAALLDDPTPTATDDAPRSWALKAAALLGPSARELTPQIIALLETASTSPFDRLLCLEALARIGPAHPQSLAAVVTVLLSEAPPLTTENGSSATDLELRMAAAAVLSLYGRSAAPAIPALLSAARTGPEPLRRTAVASLGATGDVTLHDPLADILQFDESPAVQDAAAVSLSQLGETAVPLFRQLLVGPDAETRVRAADGLGRIGAIARPALPELTAALRDVHPEVRIAAAEAVWAVSQEVQPALDAAASLLAESTREVRMRAYRLLVNVGRVTQDADLFARLQLLAESRDPRVRQAAYLALRELQATE